MIARTGQLFAAEWASISKSSRTSAVSPFSAGFVVTA